MATTTNFGWETPDDTDLVKDGAAAMRTLGNSIDTSFVDLKGGTTGQVLAKASGTDLDFSWVAQDDSNAIQNAIVDAKGDLIAATAADTPARLAVGTNGQVLTADSTASTGIKWATPATATGGLELIQTTSFSAVSSQSINSVFSSTYDSYRVVFSATAAAALTLTLRLRVSGTDDSGTNYTLQELFVNSTSVTGSRVSAQTGWAAPVIRTTLLTPFTLDIFNPFKTSPTIAFQETVDIGDPAIRKNLLIHNQNTSYDGFNMICSTSNMTGSVSIYGYKK